MSVGATGGPGVAAKSESSRGSERMWEAVTEQKKAKQIKAKEGKIAGKK